MTHSVGWKFSQNVSSLALPVSDWQCLEDIWTKGSHTHLINQWNTKLFIDFKIPILFPWIIQVKHCSAVLLTASPCSTLQSSALQCIAVGDPERQCTGRQSLGVKNIGSQGHVRVCCVLRAACPAHIYSVCRVKMSRWYKGREDMNEAELWCLLNEVRNLVLLALTSGACASISVSKLCNFSLP